MRSLMAICLAAAGSAIAHTGHGGMEGHFHTWGIEHGMLLVLVALLLIVAIKKK